MLFQIVVIEPWYSVINTAPTTTTTSTTISQPVIWSPDLFARTFLTFDIAFAMRLLTGFALLSCLIEFAGTVLFTVIPPENVF